MGRAWQGPPAGGGSRSTYLAQGPGVPGSRAGGRGAPPEVWARAMVGGQAHSTGKRGRPRRGGGGWWPRNTREQARQLPRPPQRPQAAPTAGGGPEALPFPAGGAPRGPQPRAARRFPQGAREGRAPGRAAGIWSELGWGGRRAAA